MYEKTHNSDVLVNTYIIYLLWMQYYLVLDTMLPKCLLVHEFIRIIRFISIRRPYSTVHNWKLTSKDSSHDLGL